MALEVRHTCRENVTVRLFGARGALMLPLPAITCRGETNLPVSSGAFPAVNWKAISE
jgi:hypothetical protein